MVFQKVPWLTVSGYGAHIKSTPTQLIIQRKGEIQNYPLRSIHHLVIAGGHTIHTTAIINLLKAGGAISFLDQDSNPVAFLNPPLRHPDEEIKAIQKLAPAHRYALAIATAAVRARILRLENLGKESGGEIFYKGELEFLHTSFQEMEFLVKLDEVRRLFSLTGDMYYEILSRTLPPELGFRRRTRRPHQDPVNAMLSFGYAMLFSQCMRGVTGANLDPDLGMLHEGTGSLVYDLIEPLKPTMVDDIVFGIARGGLIDGDFEYGERRCHLSEGLIERLLARLYGSVRGEEIDDMVARFRDSLLGNRPFSISPGGTGSQ
ncbi:MAG: CRISPR-associated endonuclease Cas1 [Methanomicrobiales archaeon]|nr:CRISPR-associated endonuclease Cas1 [Methanomicrobiales archaeon]